VKDLTVLFLEKKTRLIRKGKKEKPESEK